MTKILICDPSSRGLSASSVHGLLTTIANKPDDMQIDYSQPEEAAIDRVRSIIATKFLKSDGDILLFIDDDILYTPECVYLLIKDCLETKSIVTGPYIKKKMPADELALAPLPGNNTFELGRTGKLQEIKWGATGFMAIHRDVLEALADRLPLCNLGEEYPFFCPFFYRDSDHGWLYLSEDFAFCERAREAGFKIYADTRMVLGHYGKWVYLAGQGVPTKINQVNTSMTVDDLRCV